MKKAIKRLVRGDDGQLKIILIDLETLLPVTDLTGYQVISAGSASEEPEPVASVDTPEVPSQVQPSPVEGRGGGGGGGALEGRRPTGGFPPAPPAPKTETSKTTPTTRGSPRLAVEVVRPDGTPVTDPNEVRQTIADYAKQNPETAATDLLETRLTGGTTRDYSLANMEPEFRHGLAKMIEAAPPEIGNGLQIYSGYRSPEHQAKLFAASNGSGMVAPPGKSNHNHGVAADLYWNGIGFAQAPKEVQDWVHQNAAQFGLRFPMNDPTKHPYEPWHIETISARTGQPFTPPEASVPTPASRSGPFAARPEFPGALPKEDAQPSTFPARPEFHGQLPMKESGPFLARPGLTGSLPTEDAKPSTFPQRPGFAGSLPAEDAKPSTFPARPGEVFPNKDNTPFVSDDKEKDRSVAQQMIAEAKTPDMGTEVARPEARSFADKSPAYFAAHGLVDRTPEQVSMIAKTLSGELSGEQLRALAAQDPVAQRELADMIVTVENRASSKMFGSLEKTLTPSQYNSLMPEKANVTNQNYKLHGGTVEKNVVAFYQGNLVPSTYESSSYFNPQISSPTWGAMMSGATDSGNHRFGSLPEYSPTRDFQAQRQSFATFGDREGFGQNTFGTSRSPGAGRSSIDNSTAFADREGRGTFGTSDSPGVGRSQLGSGGGGALGGARAESSHSQERERDTSLGGRTSSGSTSTKSSSHSQERERDTSLGGRSPTNDGYAGSKTPGGGF